MIRIVPFLFYGLFLNILSIHGQYVLTQKLHSYRPCDTIVKQRVEYKDPGRSGTNVLWNFGKLKVLDESYILGYSQIGDSITGTEHQTMYYYTCHNDTLYLNGYENPTTWMKNIRPELLLKYPFYYGDSLTSYFQGLGKYCNDLSLHVMGTNSVKADAYGLMLMPNGDTLRNVMRVRSFKRFAEGSDELHLGDFRKSLLLPPVSVDSIECRLSSDSAVLELETFCWYVQGYRYPVFETRRSWVMKRNRQNDFFSLSFYYPPEMHGYLDSDLENLVILEDGIDESLPDFPHKDLSLPSRWDSDLNYNVYSSSSGFILEYYLDVPSKIAVYLYDMQGRCLSAYPEQFCEEGIYSHPIEFPDLSTRQYLLCIIVNGKSYSEKISKYGEL